MSKNVLSNIGENSLTLKFGSDEFVIQRRYEVASKLNDLLTGLWFVVGSVFFFFDSLQTAAIAVFLAGSVELLIRPIIGIARDVHLGKLPKGGGRDY
ncbi:MAG: YrhK family protein [Gammaproteobacteria bacterium]